MKIISKTVAGLIGNTAGLLIADYLSEGITVSRDFKELGIAVIILTIANLIFRPIVKLVLSPLVILSLGLFTFVINAGILFLVDIYSSGITISGLGSLILATVTVTILNIITRVVTKIF